MQQAPFDLVVFGATSFVGRLLTRYLLATFGAEGNRLNWAIAGRSHDRLKELCGDLGPEAMQLPLITANALDESALARLCEQTRCVVSTVGPYELLGEPMVKVCAYTGTDYCDLSGETPWIQRMITAYEPIARETGSRLIPSCGFDSIPSDLGVYFLQQEMQTAFGRPAVQISMRVRGIKGGLSGGTIASLMQVVKMAAQDTSIREDLANPYALCPSIRTHPAQQPDINEAQYDADSASWVTPFTMSAINTKVVHRSNFLLDNAYGNTFQYDEAVAHKTRLRARTAAQGERGFMLLMGRPLTRRLLTRFVVPKPGEGPSAKTQNNGYFKLQFRGRTEANETLQVTVSGDRDPGYGATAEMLGQAAACLALDLRTEDLAGGFWTPASAMGGRLLERLQQATGVTFVVTTGR